MGGDQLARTGGRTALTRHREWLGRLGDTVPMPVVGVEADGRVFYVNPALSALTGWREAGVVGVHFWEFLQDPEAEELRARFLRDIHAQSATQIDAVIPSASGELLTVRWHLLRVTNSDGALECVYAVGADISDQRLPEERLRNVNALLQTAREISGMALRGTDPHDLLQAACDSLVHSGGCVAAWAVLLGDDERPVGVVASAPAGGTQRLLAALTSDSPPMCVRDALQDPGKVHVHAGQRHQCGNCPFGLLGQSGCTIVTTLGHSAPPRGVLVVHCGFSGVAEEYRRLLASLADDLAFRLATLEREAAHSRTDRKVREQQQMLEAFFEHSLDPAAILDRDFNFIRVNRAYAEAGGYPAEYYQGRNHFEMYPHEENQRIFERVRDSREPFEIRAKPFEYPDHPEWGVTYWDWMLVPTLDESGEVALLSLWLRDVTEEQRAKQALEAQRDHLDEMVRERTVTLHDTNELLTAIIQASPVAIVVYDRQGNIRLWNHAAEELTGYPPEEVIGRPAKLVPEEAAEESGAVMARVLAGEVLRNVELLWRHRDGHALEVSVSAAPLRDPDGTVTGLVGLFADISERKRAERELHETNELLQAIIEASPVAITVHGLDGEVRLWNPAAEQLSGYAAQEAVGHPSPMVPPDKMAEYRRNLQMLAEGHEIHCSIFEWKRKDGSLVQIELSAAPLRDPEGRPRGNVVLFMDVTERLRDEQERQRLLQELSEERATLSAIIEEAPAGIMVCDAEGRIVLVNSAAAAMYGRAAPVGEDRSSHASLQICRPDLTPCLVDELPLTRACLGGVTVHNEELCIVRQDGQRLDVIASAAPILDESGGVLGAVGMFQDVTQIKDAQRRLDETNALLRTVLDEAPIAIIRLDAGGKVVEWNPAAERMSGWSREEAIGNSPPFVTEQVLPEFRELLGRLKAGEAVHAWETLRHRKDGSEMWLELHAAPVYDADGGFAGNVAAFLDVTERRRADHERQRLLERLEQHADQLEEMVAERTAALSRSRELLRQQRDFVDAVIDRAASLVIVVNDQGRIVRFNRACQELTGYSLEEVQGRSFLEVVIPEDEMAEAARAFDAVLNDGLDTYEVWWRTRDGARRRIDWHIAVVENEEGGQFAVGTGWDVTEERRLAQALAESERKYRELVENAQSVILHWDLEGTIRFINAYGLEFFGYTSEELLGRHVSVLVPDRDRHGKDLTGLVQAILDAPEDFWTNENENVTKYGRRVWVSWSNRVIRNAKGEISAILAIGNDRTEQKQAEEELIASRESLRTLAARLAQTEQRERREIASALHDHLGQLLAFSKMALGSLAGRVENGDDAEKLRQVQGYVDEAVRFTRSLTTQLAPPVLPELGLAMALEWLADDLEGRHDVAISVKVAPDLVICDEHVETTLFDSVRELVINAVKHARANEVNIRVTSNERVVEAYVEDDGIGFDPSALEPGVSRTGGYGLYSVRERLRYFGGEMAIDSTPGAGTRIHLVCPLTAQAEGIGHEHQDHPRG
ncbi:MAG: PAS domain S-box protein [Armatimonadota bacterium]